MTVAAATRGITLVVLRQGGARRNGVARRHGVVVSRVETGTGCFRYGSGVGRFSRVIVVLALLLAQVTGISSLDIESSSPKLERKLASGANSPASK